MVPGYCIILQVKWYLTMVNTPNLAVFRYVCHVEISWLRVVQVTATAFLTWVLCAVMVLIVCELCAVLLCLYLHCLQTLMDQVPQLVDLHRQRKARETAHGKVIMNYILSVLNVMDSPQ